MSEVARVAAADAQPPVFGERLLRACERASTRLVGFTARGLAEADNPLVNLGALSNFMLLVACLSGALLLLWYTPSHTGAYASVERMADGLLPSFVRGLHRYSSDAAILLALLHGLQMFVQRRFAGPRRLAWVTGFIAVFLLWLVGWLGYWLVWDERAQAVAVGTAKMLDVLPIFSDPIGRSFLTDGAVSSLLFFVVFFIHMLLPLMMVISLWLHLARLARPRWLPARRLALWSMVALTALSLLLPATSAGPAAMATTPSPATLDAWYLLPIFLTERLSGGMLWVVFLGAGFVVLGAPWLLVRRRAPRPGEAARPAPLGRAPVAVVDPARCNGCETCQRDCPYDAISMVARTDGRRFPSVALVDPDRCVGCGVCVGSCDSAGVGPVWPRQVAERHRVDGWLAEPEPADRASTIVYACARSAAAGLTVDARGRVQGLAEDLRLVGVPCAGWVHPLTLERAVRRGAERVVVVACRPETCAYREGARWTADRLAGLREPALRAEHVAGRIELLTLDPHEGDALRVALAGPKVLEKPSRRGIGPLLAVALTLVLWAPTEIPYVAAVGPPELVISLRAAGEVTETCRTRTAEELAALPPHKRVPQTCERGRADLRLVVRVDGEVTLDERLAPGGAYGDGMTTAVSTLALAPGERAIEVELGSVGAPPRVTSQRATFVAGQRHVLTYEALEGFRWHRAPQNPPDPPSAHPP